MEPVQPRPISKTNDPIICANACRRREEISTSTSVSNSDGSTTTSVTYADGSKVTMTSPAATTASSTATSSYNFIEQMIQREASALASSATASLSVSA